MPDQTSAPFPRGPLPSGPSVAAHGLIGDLRSAALVATDSSIDWFCPERFDRPSGFGAILDPDRSGRWQITPATDDHRVAEFYFPDTNVLITRFMTDAGVVELQDLMPLVEGQRLVRRIECVRGEMELTCALAARFDHGRARHTVARREGGVTLSGEELTLTLLSDAPLSIEDGDVRLPRDVGGAVLDRRLAVRELGSARRRDLGVRGSERNHLFSRLMRWVGIERMIRIARRRGLPGDIVGWSAVRDEM